jgi:hypothetical protein
MNQFIIFCSCWYSVAENSMKQTLLCGCEMWGIWDGSGCLVGILDKTVVQSFFSSFSDWANHKYGFGFQLG